MRELLGGLVCGGIVDHHEVDGVNKYWLEPYRHEALLGGAKVCPAQESELLTGCVDGLYLVEKCFPLNGPPGTVLNLC